MTIDQLQKECYQIAKDHGWMEKEVNIPEQVALIHSEISEALESFRSKEPGMWTNSEGKPEGLIIEYADAVIRICHYVELLGYNLQEALDLKLAYNKSRPYRHGGKVI